ncbi:MarR family winged helix-turn-helix transcriptional regulator [Pigmentiphaga litoralis]|uniref:DNA-binding MarR family transcriptional regulator n=1 Tax=Pigmentiphaga litoralis TaxID=516702 RepID=A0A7Y9IUD7_9BURK|nr:MarR family winged helix-turn-helix transcriptional regulator [Pigmentiphaga litoralis]NYE23381.1 DNA-binding MarR family transcriptional regulator [Pigmentiphaga litoralis]NYE83005.1 DNA-binding MarR family transcriptional regulator [Pigmentiphaga litoralis]
MPSSPSKEPRSYRPPSTTSREEFFSGGTDKAFRESIYNIVRGLDGLMSCREVFSKVLGLTGSQFAVLMGVAHKENEEGVTIRELSDHIRLAAPHVTTEVGRMIRAKLLVKRPNEADGRSVLVSLSPTGQAEVDRIAPLVRKVNDQLFQGIAADELATVTRAMKMLVLNSQRVLAEVHYGDLLDMAKPAPDAPKPRARKAATRTPAVRKVAAKRAAASKTLK